MFALIFPACGLEKDNDNYVESDAGTPLQDKMWVCYNEVSPDHEKECTKSCMEEGSVGGFCWLLEVEDCSGVYTLEWQEKYCPLLLEK